MPAVAAALSIFAHTASAQQLEKAIFAGGCFWCVESDFDKVPGVVATISGPGVVATISGYTGGKTENPTYKQVSAGGTGHYEAVEITYDPAKVSYEALLTAFWHSVDPTDGGGQFCDRGESYRTAVFFANEKQRGSAEASRNAVQKKLKKPIVSPILAATPFYAAEDYHQNYYEKNPIRYRYYRWGCGRNKKVGLRPQQEGRGGLGRACLRGHPRPRLRPHGLGPRRPEFGCTGLEDVENYLNEWHEQEELPRLIEECAQAVSDEASG